MEMEEVEIVNNMDDKKIVKKFILSTLEGLLDEIDKLKIKINKKNNYIEYLIKVDDKDYGKVIGKDGRNLKAIKTLFNSITSKLKISANINFDIPKLKKK